MRVMTVGILQSAQVRAISEHFELRRHPSPWPSPRVHKSPAIWEPVRGERESVFRLGPIMLLTPDARLYLPSKRRGDAMIAEVVVVQAVVGDEQLVGVAVATPGIH